MDSKTFIIFASTTLAVLIPVAFLYRLWFSSTAESAKKGEINEPKAIIIHPEPAKYIRDLAIALPDSLILPTDVLAFNASLKVWFSLQNRDIIPACIVKPKNEQEISLALTHLRREHSIRAKDGTTVGQGLFAVRAGGANPATGISGVKDGVILDLSLLCDIKPSADGSSVVVGAGAYWRDVYRVLEARGLGVVGGRSSPVGVGGSTLQGGLSFWSPKFGMICNNVISYQVVLADGSIVTASADENDDLWRSLKGGGNNFGVVSQFTLRSFPAPKNIWTGTFATPGFLSTRTIRAFYDHGERAMSGKPGLFDEHASTPILSLSYITNLGIKMHFCHMAYTNPSDNGNDWPEYWKRSPFRSLWRFQNTSKNESLHDSVTTLGSFSDTDDRNVFGTTTIKSDLATLLAVRQIFSDATPSIKHVKNCMFIYITQMVLPQWINKGDPNVLGLEECQEPLVIISFAVNWGTAEDDEAVTGAVRRTISRIEEFAAANGTAHPYRFSNHAAEWQKPLQGYGKNNLRVLQDVSKKYDPEGLFQTGFLGGFKLDIGQNS
ncbi:FAD-dependent monooxygenase CTB5 like protein [Verticillium longisporum]|nr:FAD-dependent monooxygenase CTB5 like protein [Verticillium longisporum]